MKNFRTLELAIEYNQQIQKLKISGHLRDQILRATSSIALNLSEGNAKFSAPEKKRFYKIAYASLKESQTALRLLNIEDKAVIEESDHLGASIYKLLKSKISAI
jgi:four helix bundle protein